MKLKLSHSIMAMWERGDTDGALAALQGVYMPPNEYMKFGIAMHKEWEREVKETNCLPAVFGGRQLVNPQTEVYKVVQLLDWLWLSGIVDLKEEWTLYDYKTGKGSASSYTNSLQSGCYKILHPEATVFRFLCWNQYTNKVSTSMVHLTEGMMQRSLDHVVTIACDIRAALENMGKEDFDNVGRALKDSEKHIYEGITK